MALPSTRRPKIVEEELKEQVIEQEKAIVFKKKFNKTSIFLDMMTTWIEDMSELNKKTLTARKFKRKAVSVLHTLRMEYDRLPLNWIKQLQDRTDLVLYRKVRKPKEESPYGDAEISVIVDPLLVPKRRGRGSDVQMDKAIKISNGSTVTVTSKTGSGSGVSVKTEVKAEDKAEGEGSSVKRRKIVDLTDRMPPEAWLEKYRKNGEYGPQRLKIVPLDDKIVIFYDYDPKPVKEVEALGLKPRIHDGNAFRFWNA